MPLRCNPRFNLVTNLDPVLQLGLVIHVQAHLMTGRILNKVELAFDHLHIPLDRQIRRCPFGGVGRDWLGPMAERCQADAECRCHEESY